MNLMKSVLRLDGTERPLGQLLAGAWLGGQLETSWAALRTQLACQALATQEGLSIPPARLQVEFNSWRRERDLIAADDLRRVLAELQLEVNDIAGCCRRKLTAEALAHRAAEALARCLPEDRESFRLLPLQVYFSSDIATIMRWAARRWVAPALQASASSPLPDRCAQLVDPSQGACIREAFGIDEGTASDLAAREQAYLEYYRSAVTPAALHRQLESSRADLARFRLALATVQSEDVACELVCCLRHDLEPMVEVGARAGLGVEVREILLRDADTLPFGGRLASAQAADVLGPSPTGDGWMVGAVLARDDPDPAVAEVRAALEDRLLERLLGPELVKRVTVTWRH